MRYTKPNCKREWDEALRYRFFENRGYEFWLKACSNGKPVKFSHLPDVGNTDFDFDNLEKEKKDRFYDAFDRGVIELPIVVKFENGNFDLLGGNTRLSGLILNKIDPYVWLIDTTNESEGIELEEKWSKKYKDSINCSNPKGFSQRAHCQGMKKKKNDQNEITGAASAGAYSAPLFGTTKKKIEEALDASSSGAFDVPFLGTTTKGRKNPLQIDGVKSIGKSRAVKDKNFPKWGGPDSVFIKIKEKCKKFPYCNQGDINAIEVLREDEELQIAIKKAADLYRLPYDAVEKVVINEIVKIFI